MSLLDAEELRQRLNGARSSTTTRETSLLTREGERHFQHSLDGRVRCPFGKCLSTPPPHISPPPSVTLRRSFLPPRSPTLPSLMRKARASHRVASRDPSGSGDERGGASLEESPSLYHRVRDEGGRAGREERRRDRKTARPGQKFAPLPAS